MYNVRLHWWQWLIIIFIELAIIGGLVVALLLLHDKQQKIVQTQDEITNNITALHEVQLSYAETLAALIENAELSQEELVALRKETKQEFADQQSATQQVVASVRTEIENQIDVEASDVVQGWGGAVALLMCGSRDAEDYSRGSGTLFKDASGLYIMTNRHVVLDGGDEPEPGCYISFPDDVVDDVYVSENDISHGTSGEDWARIRITHPTIYMRTTVAQNHPWCPSLPPAGADILILGYPSIGLENRVTVTTGIVSGYEDRYLISTAKIDRGNSGGAAIWLDEECYAGIPTKVHKGLVESLARILTIEEL